MILIKSNILSFIEAHQLEHKVKKTTLNRDMIYLFICLFRLLKGKKKAFM